jgi:hypothetical protein
MGRIVYATSTGQLGSWLEELGRPLLGIAPLRITDIIPGPGVEGPVEVFAEENRLLHYQAQR